MNVALSSCHNVHLNIMVHHKLYGHTGKFHNHVLRIWFTQIYRMANPCSTASEKKNSSSWDFALSHMHNIGTVCLSKDVSTFLSANLRNNLFIFILKTIHLRSNFIHIYLEEKVRKISSFWVDIYKIRVIIGSSWLFTSTNATAFLNDI